PTNFFFIWNPSGASPQTSYAYFSFNWSNNVPGFYHLAAIATDNYGYTNSSVVYTPVLVVLTNKSSATNVVIASMDNLTAPSNGLGGFIYPVVREGLFDLKGQA